MNAPVTRRALLGATAAVGALSLPAVAEAGIPVSDPDAELFRLLDLHPAALAGMRAAGDRAEALWDAFAAREPERPEALRVRFGDDFGVSTAQYRTRDGRCVWSYEVAAADELRKKALPTRSEWVGKPAPWDPDEQVGRWVPVPDERRIARRAEVLAAHDAWWADCDVTKARLGIPAADDADERATDALHDLQRAILDAEPATFTGLAAKARWASRCHLSAVFAADWHRRIVEDVVALAERGGVLS